MKKILIIMILAIILFLIIIYIFPVSFRNTGDAFCTQAIVRACHVITGECRDFPNACRVPDFWITR